MTMMMLQKGLVFPKLPLSIDERIPQDDDRRKLLDDAFDDKIAVLEVGDDFDEDHAEMVEELKIPFFDYELEMRRFEIDS